MAFKYFLIYFLSSMQIAERRTCVNLGNPHLQLLFSHPTSEGFKGCPDLHRFIVSLNIIHLDQGGFHIGNELEIPQNVVLLFQPAQSPELNPAEGVWEYIRAELRWLNFANLNQLRDFVDEMLKKMTRNVISSLTGWNYILNAVNIALT